MSYCDRGVSYCDRGVSYCDRGVSYCDRGVSYCDRVLFVLAADVMWMSYSRNGWTILCLVQRVGDRPV